MLSSNYKNVLVSLAHDIYSHLLQIDVTITVRIIQIHTACMCFICAYDTNNRTGETSCSETTDVNYLQCLTANVGVSLIRLRVTTWAICNQCFFPFCFIFYFQRLSTWGATFDYSCRQYKTICTQSRTPGSVATLIVTVRMIR